MKTIAFVLISLFLLVGSNQAEAANACPIAFGEYQNLTIDPYPACPASLSKVYFYCDGDTIVMSLMEAVCETYNGRFNRVLRYDRAKDIFKLNSNNTWVHENGTVLKPINSRALVVGPHIWRMK